MVSKVGQSVVNRRQVRQVVVQTLYQYTHFDFDTDLKDALAFVLESGNFPEAGYDQVKSDYLLPLLHGIIDHLQEIDAKIESYLNDWTIDRIARIDLNILRVAFYEIFYGDSKEVPAKVAVDQAIELSKFFSDEKSRQFISGVLAAVLSDLDARDDSQAD